MFPLDSWYTEVDDKNVQNIQYLYMTCTLFRSVYWHNGIKANFILCSKFMPHFWKFLSSASLCLWKEEHQVQSSGLCAPSERRRCENSRGEGSDFGGRALVRTGLWRWCSWAVCIPRPGAMDWQVGSQGLGPGHFLQCHQVRLEEKRLTSSDVSIWKKTR